MNRNGIASSLACALALALVLLGVTGCSSSLTVTRINSDEAEPNNVWVFFTVENGEEPIGGLTADDFEIYEDDKLVSKFESKQVILNPEVAAVMYTMLLLDMSGSVTESGEADLLVDAATVFNERVSEQQKVGVYAFDGADKIHSVVPFTERQGSVEGGLEGLRGYKPKDPSTNLNGAVILGLQELKKALDKDKRPMKFGTLVVFSDGTDRAGRVSEDEMQEELGKDDYGTYEIYAIGVGAELEEKNLSKIGKDGTELAIDNEKVHDAFEKVADKIENHMKRFYLLSYCTPSRAGEHSVRIVAIDPGEDKRNSNRGSGEASAEAEAESGEGSASASASTSTKSGKKKKKSKAGGKGSLEYTFSAEEFGPPPECNPERKPKFRLDKIEPVADDEEIEVEDDDGGAKRKKKSKNKGMSQPRQPGGG